MSNINVTGNITRDLELRYSDGGNAYTRFGVAVSRKDKAGTENTSFFDVVAFGSLAENAASSLAKGNRVTVAGRVEVKTYEKKDGTGEGKSVEIVADSLGPDLRWATATVYKNERINGGGNSNYDAF